MLIPFFIAAMLADSATQPASPPATKPAASAPAADLPNGPLERGRAYTAWFYAGEVARLWERFAPEMQAAMSADALAAFRKQVDEQLGPETGVRDEKVTPVGAFQVYTRTASFTKFPGAVVVQWTLDGEGKVGGFFVRPAQPAPAESKEAPSPHLGYATKTPLHLPFTGEWSVFWGGRSVEENYHAATTDQRFAYDIVVAKDGKSHEGDGTRNDQYYCFGRPILAPAAGKAVVVVDGIEDNVPGEMNRAQPPGNYIVLDHGNGEFSFLAHFQKGSIQVAQGADLAAGAVLGRCGNSGNSSEPHLHYHLQTTPTFRQGEGLPAQFLDYVADGKEVARGEPTRGQTIRTK